MEAEKWDLPWKNAGHGGDFHSAGEPPLTPGWECHDSRTDSFTEIPPSPITHSAPLRLAAPDGAWLQLFLPEFVDDFSVTFQELC